MLMNDGGVLTGETITVADLFGVVADALIGLEDGLARLEQALLAQRLLNGTSTDEARAAQRSKMQLAPTIDLDDRILVARQTVFWVLQHPVQGLGPTAGDSRSSNRRHLAAVGGFNTRTLQLLSNEAKVIGK